jgi:hypothetical protein
MIIRLFRATRADHLLCATGGSVPKMDEDTPEIAVVFLNAVVQRPNVRLIEKPQDMLLELTAAFTRNNFHEGDAFRNRLLYNPVQLFVDLTAVVVDVV